MNLTTIIWICYWATMLVSIPQMASMVYRYSQYQSDLHPTNYAYDVNPPVVVAQACGLAFLWPLGWIALLTLFAVTKTDRERVAQEKQAKMVESVKAFLREQEEKLKTDFEEQVEDKPAPTEAVRTHFRHGWKKIGGPW